MKPLRLTPYTLGFAIAALFAFACALFLFDAHAANTYYFNNAVNTDPAELGNYWNDASQMDPASQLPDFSVDEVYVVSGATFNGSATFNGNATNEGTVAGDAIFNGDLSEDNGTVVGTRTRRYSSPLSTVRNLIGDGGGGGNPWTVLADGAAVDVSGASYDGTTTFATSNGGSFVYLIRRNIRSQNSTLTLTYNKTLNAASVPSASDFTLLVNGSSASVSSVAVTGSTVVLSLASPIVPSDTAVLTYAPGVDPIEDQYEKPASSFSAQAVLFLIPAGDQPHFMAFVGTKMYVLNYTANTVTVIDTDSNTVLATLSAGTNPEYIFPLGTKVYIPNQGSANVTVIDSVTDTVTATIPIGNSPGYPLAVGNKIYVTNALSDTVSVINTTTDTVSATISVGDAPVYPVVVGTKLYVGNSGANTVSVINTLTDTVIGTVTVGTAPVYAFAVGTKLYVSNTGSSNLSVINTTTDTVSATIALSANPEALVAYGTKIYVTNPSADTVSVINTATDTVVTTIAAGDNPFFIGVDSRRVYVVNNNSANLSVINPATNTVVANVATGDNPYTFGIIGTKMYLADSGTDYVHVLDTETVSSQLPNLVSFTSTASSGSYVNGQGINITANFGRSLLAGSTMTVALNSGGAATLSTVSGKTLSGTYTVGPSDATPDLAVSSVTSASVTDSTSTYTRTSYSLPSSVGSFVGENSFITRNIGDSKNIVIGSYRAIATGDNPYQVSSAITVGGVQYVYVANQGAGTVSVIRLSDGSTVATIAVGSEPYGLATVTLSGIVYVYVVNTLSNTVSVINTATNTVTATVAVGVRPYYAAAVGTNVYVTNGASNTVSVINANTNTVTATIAVGSYPRGIKAHGTDLYVANYGDPNYSGGNYISVIDSTGNTVSGSVVLPAGSFGPRGVTVLGDNVYVANYRSNNVSVINANTNTVTATVAVGTGPRGLSGVGTKIYAENFDAGTISVIDTNSNTVTATVVAGHSPAGMGVVGTDIYFSRFQDNKLSILDTTTNLLRGVTAPSAPVIGTATAGNQQAVVTFSVPPSDGGSAITSYTVTSSPGSVTASGSSSPITVTGLANGTTYTFTVTATNAIGTGSASDASNAVTPSAPASGGGGGHSIIPPPPPPVCQTNCGDSLDSPNNDDGSTGDTNPPPGDGDAPSSGGDSGNGGDSSPAAGDGQGSGNSSSGSGASSGGGSGGSVAMTEDGVHSGDSAHILKLWTGIETFLKTPAAEHAMRIVSGVGVVAAATISAVSALFINPLSMSELFLLPARLWTLIMTAFGLKKRRRPWGTVYDSVTKQPLDPAYVTLLDASGNEMTSSITDLDGRYGFLMNPGTYHMVANKTHYMFPSKKLAGKTVDEIYQDLYFGEPIVVTTPDQIIAKNIPMDPTNFDWNEFAKQDQKLMRFYSHRDVWLTHVTNILFSLGFTVSFVATLSAPKPYNIAIFSLYLILLAIRKVGHTKKSLGGVMDKSTGYPLPFAIVRIFWAEVQKEIIHKITDAHGRFYCLIPNGTYYATVSRKNADESYTEVYRSSSFTVTHGYIDTVFEV